MNHSCLLDSHLLLLLLLLLLPPYLHLSTLLSHLQDPEVYCDAIRLLISDSTLVGQGGQGSVYRLPCKTKVIKVCAVNKIEDVRQALFERELGSLLSQTPGIVTANKLFATWASPNRLLGPEHGREFDKVDPDRSRLMVLQEQRFVGSRSLLALMDEVRIIDLHMYGDPHCIQPI